jgi:CheY-like chemotaxis protein
MPRLFDLFVQGERSLDRSEGGLGIGLSIAKSLCELHGGSIAVHSDGLGHGSTFRVTLPLARAQAVAAEDARPDERPAAPCKSRRVLVVDDNVDAAQTLQDFLAARGHETAMAHDGLSALAIATAFKPAIAVLDIGLPVMDGYELASKLRAEIGPQELRLIAVTGYGQESDRVRTLQAGFDHHLVKPVSLEALVTLLEDEPAAPESSA